MTVTIIDKNSHIPFFSVQSFFTLIVCGFFISVTQVIHAQSQSKSDTVKNYYNTVPKRLKEKYIKNDSFPGKIHGHYIAYYESGNIKTKGFYYNNIPEGNWKYFYENGGLKSSAYFKNGQANGYHTYYYESGCPSGEGLMVNGARSDKWKFYYENCKLKKEGRMEGDQPMGLWKHYYEDGKDKAIANYTAEGGYYKEFFTTGKVKAEGKVVNGKSDSLWRYYYPSGMLKAEGYESAGLKNGMWRYYHGSGNIASEGYYVNGKSSGFWKYFNDTGELTAEGSMEEGQKNGFWKLYYAGGKIRGEGNFAKGDGDYKEYYENGKLKLTGKVKNGKNDGEWNYYDEEGNKEGLCKYVMGTGLYTGYYPNGNVKMTGTLEDGKKTGTWTLYKAEGGLAGYLKTVYEKDKQIQDPGEDDMWTSGLPASEDSTVYRPLLENTGHKPENTPATTIKSQKHRIRYFIPKEGEYRSLIVGGNPIALIFNSIPMYFELYNQERLGYEFIFTFYRSPLTQRLNSLDYNEVLQTGRSIAMKQKFYSNAGKSGMVYFAHELRYSNFFYESNITPGNPLPTSVANENEIKNIKGAESLYEYSVLIGDRFISYPGRPGFTVDIFIGMGIGYRDFRQSENSADYDRVFGNINRKNLNIPIRFGFSLGYLF